MNWSYLKFVSKKYAFTFSLFIFLIILSFVVPKEFYGEDPKEVHILVLLGVTLLAAVKTIRFDFISSAVNSKPTSMKYMLSLNMSKKEFFINYCFSQYILLFPCVLSSLMAFLVYNNFENVLLSTLKFIYIWTGLIFFVAASHFRKKYFIHKPESFQEQYIKGHNAYFMKLTALIFLAAFAFLTLLDYYQLSIPFFNIEASAVITLVFLGIVAIPFYWQLYVPALAIIVVLKCRSDLKAFNNRRFFQGKFHNEKKEKRMAFAVFLLLFFISSQDTPPSEFAGNKLTQAIYSKDFDLIKTHSTPENINKFTKAQLSPLSAAAYTGQWDVYQYLKSKGAKNFSEVTINKRSYNLLELSILGKNPQIVEDVLSLKEFDLNQENQTGSTPLHLASLSCQSDIAKVLVKNGANVNIQNKNGQTPLHLSIHSSCNDLGLVLLSLGADPTISDKNNKVALDFKKESLLPFLEEQLRRPASIEEGDD